MRVLSYFAISLPQKVFMLYSLRVRRRVLTIAFRATFVLIHIFQCVAI